MKECTLALLHIIKYAELGILTTLTIFIVLAGLAFI